MLNRIKNSAANRQENAASYEQRQKDQARARQQELGRRAWRFSGVPDRHKNTTADFDLDPVWTGCADKAIRVVENLGIGALIGGRGVGKTQAAVECARKVCVIGQTVRYTVAADIFLAIRDTYRKDAPRSETEVLRDYTTPHLLIVDEIQERGDSDATRRAFTLILDKRYRDGRPTLLIGNLTADEDDRVNGLRANVGESIWDRMIETGGFIVFKCASWRTREDKR